jgi:hypothetical protein
MARPSSLTAERREAIERALAAGAPRATCVEERELEAGGLN